MVGGIEGVLHAQRLQDALGYSGAKRLARDLAHDLLEEDVVDVGVGGLLVRGLELIDLLGGALDGVLGGDVGLGVGVPVLHERLVGEIGDAAVHPEEVVYGDLLCVGEVGVPLGELVRGF